MSLLNFLFGRAKPDIKLDTSRHDPKLNYCRPSLPDENDYFVPADEVLLSAFPSGSFDVSQELVDLRGLRPAVRNQQLLGSCASHGVIAAYEHELERKGCFVEMSELYHYYQARRSVGDELRNVGMDLRTACSILKSEGLSFEKFWPYEPLNFKTKPSANNFFANLTLNKMGRFCVKAYFLADSLEDAKAWMRQGHWIICGIRMFPKFNDAYGKESLGIDSIKNVNVNLYGGHCVNLVGFDEKTKRVLVRNSWGSFWGRNGYCWLDYELFSKVCFEMRVLSV